VNATPRRGDSSYRRDGFVNGDFHRLAAPCRTLSGLFELASPLNRSGREHFDFEDVRNRPAALAKSANATNVAPVGRNVLGEAVIGFMSAWEGESGNPFARIVVEQVAHRFRP